MMHMLASARVNQTSVFIRPMMAVEKNLKTKRVRVGISTLNHGKIYGIYGTTDETKKEYTIESACERCLPNVVILPYIATSIAEHNHSKMYNYYIGEQLVILGELPRLDWRLAWRLTPNMLCPEHNLHTCTDMNLIPNGRWHTVQDDTGNGANSQCTS